MPRVKRDPNIPVFDFQLNPDKPNLSQSTLNIYKGYLNKITEDSYHKSLADKRKKPIKNKKDLLTKYKQVVEYILSASESRQIRCGMFSAVFYAIGDKNLKKNKRMEYIVTEFRKIYNDKDYEDYKKKKAEQQTATENLNASDEE